MEFLSQINDYLITNFGDLGPLYAVGVLGIVLISLTLPIFLKKQYDPLDKLKGQNVRGASFGGATGDKKDLRFKEMKGAEKLDRFASFLEPQDEEEMSSARLLMMQAGYRSKSAVRTFHFAQFALGILFLILGVLYAIVSSTTGEVTTQQMVLSIIIPGAVGYYIPKYWVNRRLQTRQQEITNGFPDALDMMLVCVEAGQSVEQSIIRVAKELRAGFPALADEFEIVANETKAGKDKAQVLKDMAERAGVSDVASFVTVMIQSASFGTSIAEALRVYAAEMRDKRVMRAEEKANVLPTKLTLGTMMFTVPPLMIILVGPSVYDIYITLTNSNF
ncbi:type II secretion system F family protein [Actibacterium sp. 188UL27-1]|uniref:type II secretion system F family protein n=1 Tax=Actibacterium sp. 188UL27-1 TaxID=2786961 RepID=UPI001958CA0A|nr:type II secretion system F family protein [Actibacterium sp. 188UL27-1]MBM7068206.1 type II secretion system F family protein [Actibacterium sp. 188UL27-1]